jgi:hypothetical protein
MKRKQLLNEVKRRYRKLKEEALDRILWRTRSERGSNYRKTDKRDDDIKFYYEHKPINQHFSHGLNYEINNGDTMPTHGPTRKNIL